MPATNGTAASDAPWGTSDLKAALPSNSDGAEGAVATEGEPAKPTIPEGWVKAEAYDYDNYSKDANHDWDGNAKIYEWDGEEGEVGPVYPELEIELFGAPESRVSHGIDFSK
jgi:ATP-dependent RNA helicase DDX3X